MMRALLIWLLALALPMQGAVAADMVFCGPGHHARVGVAATAPHPDAAQAGHELAALSQVTRAHDQAEQLAGDGAAAPSKLASTDLNKCSVCAACCSSAVIQAAPLELPVGEGAGADFAPLVSRVEACAASGPERPPRACLA